MQASGLQPPNKSVLILTSEALWGLDPVDAPGLLTKPSYAIIPSGGTPLAIARSTAETEGLQSSQMPAAAPVQHASQKGSLRRTGESGSHAEVEACVQLSPKGVPPLDQLC